MPGVSAGPRQGGSLATILLAVATVVIFSFLALSFIPGADCAIRPGAASCTRVLFIGNSLTYVNDLPGTFASLARSGNHHVVTGMVAEGGWTFSDHAKSARTLEAIQTGHWNYVVLQEQSEIPALEQPRMTGMYPSARLLVEKVRKAGEKPLFFLTWAHHDGAPELGLPGFDAMQVQLEAGYLQIARELDAPIAPAGDGWLEARKLHPQLDLWQSDGTHPSEQGTYLAACVFYAVIFRQSPVGLPYRARLSPEDAQTLQKVAADVVFKDPERWNLR